MSAPMVAIIDSGGANINSIVFAFERLGCRAIFTDDWKAIQQATHVVLPGVGSAFASMNRLRQSGLDQLIPNLRQPVVGICLGMQLLFASSQEARSGKPVDCLGIVQAQVQRLPSQPGLTIPHMGWNRNRLVEGQHSSLASAMFDGLADGFFSYFVHSYAAPIGPWTAAKCNHGQWFSSMVAWRNFFGIQFHPERSSAIGMELLKRFLSLDSEVTA